MQVVHQGHGPRFEYVRRHNIIWHKYCIAMSGRNGASDLHHSAAGIAHNDVRNVFEVMV